MDAIAKLAGVSKGTVSKALNGEAGVSVATRDRIRALAAKHNFHANATASALARRRTGAFALAIPNEAGPVYEGAFWASLIVSVVSAASRRGIQTVILTPDAGEAGAEAFDSALRRRSVDALIIAAELLDQRTLAALISENIPYVRVGGELASGTYSVDVDNEGGAREMAARLVSAGRRRIAFLAGPERYGYTAERVAGYEAALQEAGIESRRVERSAYDAKAAREATRAILSSTFEPDALFVGAGGPLMFGALEGWRGAGGSASGVALAVFDDSPILELMDPPVSAVRQPIARMAEAAIAVLNDLVEGRKIEEARVVLDTELVARGVLAF
jgi:DNA-binding LacI/PurR family transcriptional regulator